jgi:aspartyl protease family protein
MKRRHALVAAGSLLWAGSAWASQVVLAGRMGERALLVINGRPHTLAVGATAAGVRFVRWQDDLAEVDAGAGPVKLRIGGAPALLSGTQRASSAREIVIPAAGGGPLHGAGVHQRAGGSVHGGHRRHAGGLGSGRCGTPGHRPEPGAWCCHPDRQRPGAHADGDADRVRVGEVEVANVGAAVLPMPMPYVLLGNSFLSRFQMRRDNDVMRLELR